MNNYNNNRHSVTDFKPNEVFYSISAELYEKVYINTLNYYKKNKSTFKIDFKIGEKCFVNNIMW